MDVNLPVIAGTISTTMFALSNVANLVHSVYVFDLPPGPIWLLHTFYLLSMALMLAWYLRYEWQPGS